MSSLNEILCPEIFDMIFACLQDDLKSLGICGLVCTSWMLHTRHRLQFHTVDLNMRNMAGFVKLFRDHSSTPSTIIPFIRNFRYTCVESSQSGGFPRFFLPAHASRPALSVNNSFTEILHRLPPLPAVTSVMLQRIRWEIDRDDPVDLAAVFPHIVDLELCGVAYPINTPLTSPHLTQSPVQDATLWPHIPSGVKSFIFDRQISPHGFRLIYELMLLQRNPPLFQRLKIFSWRQSDLKALAEFTQNFGKELTDLTIWEESDWSQHEREDIDLANTFSRPESYESLGKLKSLQISSRLIGCRGKSWALSLLSGLQYPLQSLQLRIRNLGDRSDTEIEDPAGWNQLFNIFRQRQFSELRELKFVIKGAETRFAVDATRINKVESMIRMRFEKETSLSSRCTLSFGQIESSDEAV